MNNRVWYTVLIVAVLASIGLAVQCGCGPSAKTEQSDRFTKIEKKQEDQDLRIKGNENAITTVKNDLEINIQQTKKNAQTIQGGMGFNAETVEKVESEVDNTKNSTVLMIVLFGMNILAFVGLIVWLTKRRK